MRSAKITIEKNGHSYISSRKLEVSIFKLSLFPHSFKIPGKQSSLDQQTPGPKVLGGHQVGEGEEEEEGEGEEEEGDHE